MSKYNEPYQNPRVPAPESSMLPGMAVASPAEPQEGVEAFAYTGGSPNIWDSSVPGAATQPGPPAPLQWVYDFDPTTGASRATFDGQVWGGAASTGTPGSNTSQFATQEFVMEQIADSTAGVSTWNSRSGNVTLELSDITGAGGATAAELANYVLIGGDIMSGNLTVPGLYATGVSVSGAGTALNVTSGGANIAGQLESNTLVVAANAQVNGNLGCAGNMGAAEYTMVGGAFLGPFSTTGWQLVDGSNGYRMVMANQNPPWNWQNAAGTTTMMSLSATGLLNVGSVTTSAALTVGGTASFSGSVNVPAAGITYSGGGSVGFATTGTTLLAASINSGALQWVVIGSIGGYQACNELGFASNFSYAVMGQSGSLYSWTVAASDRRLKSNIRDCDRDALGIINEIAVHDLDCQMHPDIEPEHWSFSLITDEVKPHLPYAVISPPDIDGTTVYESFHTQHLISVLWRAVQQLTSEVKELTATVEELKEASKAW